MKLISRSARHVFVLVGAVTLSTHGLAARETEIPWKIGEETAQRLAAQGHYGDDKYIDSFDYNRGISPPFFVFAGVNDAPAEGGFGYFAVNPWTGDVWELWGCHRLSTPALRRSQAAIRRRFTRDEMNQYTRLRGLKPICTYED
jgi:hypothetical protein